MRKIAVLAAAASALAAGLAAPGPAGAHYLNPGSVECRGVTFAPGTDWGASGIWTRGASCTEARRLAWDFKDRRYGVYKRYRCERRGRQGGHRGFMQAHTDVRCVRKGSRSRVVVTMALT